jgi:ATP-dependent RNA helicase RhlE
VVNFDVPTAPEDYIHRVGRTARAEQTGDAFTFVSPDEEPELRGIERAIGRKLPRILVPDFDYAARPETKLEIPLAERIAQIRAKKAEDRERSKAKAARREANGQASSARPASRADRPGGGAGQRGPARGGHGSGGRPGSGGGRPGGSGGAGGRPAARGGR